MSEPGNHGKEMHALLKEVVISTVLDIVTPWRDFYTSGYMEKLQERLSVHRHEAVSWNLCETVHD